MKHVSIAEFSHGEGERLIAFWRAEYIEHQIEPREPRPGLLIADAGFAQVTVEVVQTSCRIEIACVEESTLPDMRTGISRHMVEFDPALPALAWSGNAEAGALPPTFAAAEVVGCEPVGASWWRMTLGTDAAGYARFSSDDHWHFRLLRPRLTGRDPVWPRLDGNGVIVWPETDDALTDRVFTIRDCDAERQTVTFDIFRHPGGPTCDWAETVPLGQKVGLMGPGAKAGPRIEAEGDRLLVGGDETSVPAILRGLERLPSHAVGGIVLLVGSEADRTISSAPGVQLSWLLRSEGAAEDTLVTEMRRRLGHDQKAVGTTRLWFAASKAAARSLRAFAQDEAGLDKSRVHSVAYWS